MFWFDSVLAYDLYSFVKDATGPFWKSELVNLSKVTSPRLEIQQEGVRMQRTKMLQIKTKINALWKRKQRRMKCAFKEQKKGLRRVIEV